MMLTKLGQVDRRQFYQIPGDSIANFDRDYWYAYYKYVLENKI